MHYLGLDGHDFISDRLNDFTARFDWVICNNTIIKNAKNDAQPPRTICMKTDFLPKYVDLIASLGSETGGGFVLLTCSSMYSPAYHYLDETRRILENPHLVAWFSENNTMAEGAAVNPHPKMRHFPAGLNFHNSELQMECERALLQISAEGGGAEVPARNFLYCPPHGRELLNDNYCKTFCGVSRNLIRGEPFLAGVSTAVDYYYIGAKNPTSPIADQYRDYYQSLKQYKFLLCPHEATIDPCPPRVWEALALGVIPVMIHNTLSENLYRGLPIWFIEDWSQIFSVGAYSPNQLCKKYRELMRASPYSPHQLTADYWFERVNRAFSGMSPEVCPATGNCFLPKPRDYIEQKKQVSFSAEIIESSPPTPPPIQKTPRIVFAFCIYGSNPMYYAGLNENIRIISREFGEDAHVYIYAGTSAILSNLYRDNDTTHVFETGHDGVINMIYRYSGVIAAAAAMAADVESPEFYFVRDADSIIGDRDLWCIRDFIATAISSANITAHVIRDHFHHKSKMTGGLTGFTKLGMSLVSDTFRAKIADFHQGDYSVYGNDEEFLNQHIYPLLFTASPEAHPLIHSNFCVMRGELSRPILCRNTLTNFCGNVRQIAPFPHFQFLYSDFDVNAQWKWCAEHEAYALFIQTILSLRRTYCDFNDSDLDPHAIDAKRLYGGLKELPYSSRSRTVAYLIEAYLHCGDINGCYAAYQLYAYCEIHERAKELMWDVIRAQTRPGVTLLFMTSGCTEGYEAMKDYSVCAPIIVYGAFADDWTAYPCSQIIYRNVWYYERDRAECEKRGIPFEWIENSVWTPVKKIYIMGLDVAPDRIYETKQELARVGISLDKIQPYLAKKDADRNGAYLGATKNHADVLAAALNALSEQPPKMDEVNYNSSVFLFLEDDFVFSGDPTEQLNEFWRGEYDYDICLLAASKMHERAELDDLISYSKQYCTTSSAYFVPARTDTLEKVAALVLEGYEKMKETGDTVTYCIDRYWTKIQPANRMILFREKLGFQRPSMSKITGALNAMLD